MQGWRKGSFGKALPPVDSAEDVFAPLETGNALLGKILIIVRNKKYIDIRLRIARKFESDAIAAPLVIACRGHGDQISEHYLEISSFCR
jgi:hypothetical protein